MNKTVIKKVKKKIAVCTTAFRDDHGRVTTYTEPFDVTGIRYSDVNSLLAKIRKKFEYGSHSIVSIDDVKTVETVYSMPLDEFIEQAEVKAEPKAEPKTETN